MITGWRYLAAYFILVCLFVFPPVLGVKFKTSYDLSEPELPSELPLPQEILNDERNPLPGSSSIRGSQAPISSHQSGLPGRVGRCVTCRTLDCSTSQREVKGCLGEARVSS